MMATTETLRCNKCEQFLPTTAFAINRRAGDRGYQYTCRECRKPIAWEQNLKKYGMKPDEFDILWAKSNASCDICSKPLERGGPTGFAVDHNHTTGEVRGLLCHLCNTGIGCLQDSPAILHKALTYLNDNGHYGPKEA